MVKSQKHPWKIHTHTHTPFGDVCNLPGVFLSCQETGTLSTTGWPIGSQYGIRSWLPKPFGFSQGVVPKDKGVFWEYTPQNLTARPWKMMVGRWGSFWDRLFLGAVLNFQGVLSPARSFSFSEFFQKNTKCQIYQSFAKYNRTREFSTIIRGLKWSLIFPIGNDHHQIINQPQGGNP